MISLSKLLMLFCSILFIGSYLLFHELTPLWGALLVLIYIINFEE